MSLSNRLSDAMTEAELIHVDADGYAHDDEGNRWFVGKQFPEGQYRPRDVPLPAAEPVTVDNTARIEAFVRLPQHQVTSSFGQSILRQLKYGRALTEPQKKAVRQMFYRARMRDDADLFR